MMTGSITKGLRGVHEQDSRGNYVVRVFPDQIPLLTLRLFYKNYKNNTTTELNFANLSRNDYLIDL